MREGDATLTLKNESAPHVSEEEPIDDIHSKSQRKDGTTHPTEDNAEPEDSHSGNGSQETHKPVGMKKILDFQNCGEVCQEKDKGSSSTRKVKLGRGRLGDTTWLLPRHADTRIIEKDKISTRENHRLGSTFTTRLSPRQVPGTACSAVGPDVFSHPLFRKHASAFSGSFSNPR